jgi:hypothetical protein
MDFGAAGYIPNDWFTPYNCGVAGDAAIASRVIGMRKVRTAKGPVLDNVKAEQSDGKCNRKQTAGRNPGKGEMVR